ncbi:hypothetical protein OAK19_02745 [Aureispira]|nr:hypothetical protein [Aureispira sp.]
MLKKALNAVLNPNSIIKYNNNPAIPNNKKDKQINVTPCLLEAARSFRAFFLILFLFFLLFFAFFSTGTLMSEDSKCIDVKYSELQLALKGIKEIDIKAMVNMKNDFMQKRLNSVFC